GSRLNNEYKMDHQLNNRAARRCERLAERAGELRITVGPITGGGRFFDFGVNATGGLQAGLELARACLADLGDVSLGTQPLFDGRWPVVQIATDHPVAACLLSQYAGWQIKTDDFFAMGSGPMRAVACREELFEKLACRETADRVVGVLETGQVPEADVYEFIAERSGVSPADVDLLGASVCSLAGNVQVVARSVETSLHKLFELGFDVFRVQSGIGTAPLPPVAKDDLTGISRTNDAILYGADVALWVTGDDDSLRTLGPQVPADSSDSHGRPFVELFEAAGRDFYAVDPQLFSPAVVTFHNLDTGNTFRFGRTVEAVLRESFGV
ncbi:MAG: methenyltetrahydromethanopterin cyclohydrolase, partial [Planctomycetaceae bacterium]